MVMLRFIEPARPEDYRDLPRFIDLKYWRGMARALKLIKPGVMEINRYHDQRMRVTGLFGALFLTVLIIGIPIHSAGSLAKLQAEMAENYDYVFNFEERIRQKYKEKISWRTKEKYTEQEYVEQYLSSKRHSNRFINTYYPHLIFGSAFLGILMLPLFFPRRCPVRFDRNRELAYTWHKGKFYVADIGPYLGGLDARIGSSRPDTPLMEHDKATGPVILKMSEAGNPENTHAFRIGPYPVFHAHQNVDINMMISAFMSKHLYDAEGRKVDWNDDWLKQIDSSGFYPSDVMRIQGEWTLGKKHGFDEQATEAALMEYLTDPKTRDRGQPVWRR